MSENLQQMLDSVTWGEFTLGHLANISSGKDISNKDKQIGDTPYISSSEINNGISHYISNDDVIMDRNVLSVARTGSVGATFYHNYNASFSNNVRRIDFGMDNLYVNLFLKTSIEHQREKYEYGYIMGTGRLSRQKILLPVTHDGNPDWEFMKRFMLEIEKEVKPTISFTPHTIKDNRSLEDLDWKEFEINQIADVKSGKDIYSTERIEGDIPYVTSTAQTNGVGYFIGNDNQSLEKDCISVNRNGSVGFSFYHGYHALYGNDVRKVVLKNNMNTNKYISLFITTTIMKQKEKYSYSVKLGTKRLKKQKILLPVKDDGTPDWKFMEQFMKRLENEAMSEANKTSEEV